MASQTTNLHLVKPAYGETADVSTFNGNMDLIDTAVNEKAAKGDSIKNITRSGTTYTATRADGTTFTFTQQDNNTTYAQISRGSGAGLAPGLPSGSGTTKYLREDGTWQVPPDTNTTYSAATQSANGLMSAADKKKLDGIAAGANAYSLPLAASGTRGGVQLGYSTNGKNYAVQQSGEKLYVNVPWTDTNTTYSAATQSANGLMSAADKKKLDGIATGANAYSLPLAASGTRGGVQLGYSTSGKNYAVQQSGEKLYVNVPWTDTDTNTWRGIQNNLTSSSTTESLSAYQGQVLKSGINYKYSAACNAVFASECNVYVTRVGRMLYATGTFKGNANCDISYSNRNIICSTPSGEAFLKLCPVSSEVIFAFPLATNQPVVPVIWGNNGSFTLPNNGNAVINQNTWYAMFGVAYAPDTL